MSADLVEHQGQHQMGLVNEIPVQWAAHTATRFDAEQTRRDFEVWTDLLCPVLKALCEAHQSISPASTLTCRTGRLNPAILHQPGSPEPGSPADSDRSDGSLDSQATLPIEYEYEASNASAQCGSPVSNRSGGSLDSQDTVECEPPDYYQFPWLKPPD